MKQAFDTCLTLVSSLSNASNACRRKAVDKKLGIKLSVFKKKRACKIIL